MKAIKLLTVAVLLGTCAGVAHAATVTRFTGSTAYRANVEQAILRALGSSNGSTLTTGSFAYNASALGSASQSIFYGLLGGTGTSVTIATSWTGSEGGIQVVSTSGKTAYLAVGAPGTSGSGSTVSSGTDSEIPDVTMSDTYQSSSAYFGKYGSTFYPTLTEDTNSPVGVVPFKFVASKGSPAAVKNVSPQILKILAGAGNIPVALFSGSNADENTQMLFTGRDPDSGTRLSALAETGYGLGAQTVTQYEPEMLSSGTEAQVTGTAQTINAIIPWPVETVNGLTVPGGNGGYNSGGSLAGAMGAADPLVGQPVPAALGISGTLGGFVTYLGTNDSDGTAIPGGAVELSYNGTTLGIPAGGNYNNDAHLTEGAYTFWGYEHMYYRSNAGASVIAVADSVASQVLNTTAIVLLGNMQVARTSDGGTLGTNY